MDPEDIQIECSDAIDHHLDVLRERLRVTCRDRSHQELNQEYWLREWNGTEAQVAHGRRHERLQPVQHELAQVGDLGRRIHLVDKIRGQNRPRLHLVEQEKAL